MDFKTRREFRFPNSQDDGPGFPNPVHGYPDHGSGFTRINFAPQPGGLFGGFVPSPQPSIDDTTQRCPRGHALVFHSFKADHRCDKCKVYPVRSCAACQACNYDLCLNCCLIVAPSSPIEQVTKLRADVDEMQASLGHARASIDRIHAEFNDVRKKMEDMRGAMDTIQANQQSTVSMLQKLANRVDRVEQ
jgi:hypothetical protein